MKFTFKEIEELLAKRREFSISIQRKLVEKHASLFSRGYIYDCDEAVLALRDGKWVAGTKYDGFIYFYVGGELYHTSYRDVRSGQFYEISGDDGDSWAIFDAGTVPKTLRVDAAVLAPVDKIYRDAGLPAPFGTPEPAPIPVEVPVAIVEAVKGVVPEPIVTLPVPQVAANETSRGDLLEMV